MKWTVLFALFFGLAASKETIVVVMPPWLSSMYNGSIYETPALFGIPSYGSSITGIVLYATPGQDEDGCTPIKPENMIDWPQGDDNKIFLIDRGNCTFSTKIAHAQQAGANAVIVVDNREERNLPYMADDRTGQDISIPSVLIRKSDGENFKAAVKSVEEVIVSLTWGIPNPDNRVEWSLWTSAYDTSSSEFKRSFSKVSAVLDEHAFFQPHYTVWKYRSCQSPRNPCGDLCTNSGRYCSDQPVPGITGRTILEEDLRQICLWNILNHTSTRPLGTTRHMWWNYVNAFDELCINTFTQTCSHNQLKNLHPDLPSLVEQCVTDSGGTTKDQVNTLFEAEVDARITHRFFIYKATVIVNEMPYRGSLTCPSPVDVSHCGVLGSICAGYSPGSKPSACTSAPGCEIGQVRDECGVCGGQGQMDACMVCLPITSPNFNQTCAGCDGIPHSGLKNDPCGVCNGDGSFDACGRCLASNDPDRFDGAACPTKEEQKEELEQHIRQQVQDSQFPMSAIIAIAVGGLLLIGIVVFLVMRHRQKQMSREIDHIMQRYHLLDNANRMDASDGNSVPSSFGEHDTLE